MEAGYIFLFLLLLAAAVLIAGLAPWQEKMPQVAPQEKNPQPQNVLIETSGAAIGGKGIFAYTTSACGQPVRLYLDGKLVGEEKGKRAIWRIPAISAGNHLLAAVSGECRGSLSLIVPPAACKEGEFAACAIEGCAGARQCENGIFTECVLPKRMCKPGAVQGCSLNSCSFGYSKCNGCGGGWGPCLPSPQIGGTLTSCP